VVNRAVAFTTVMCPTAIETNADLVAKYLEDAAHYPGGLATGVARPATVDEVAWVIAQSGAVLTVGAQSSLTGGATPAGGIVLSTERLNHLRVGERTVTVGAGVSLLVLQQELARRGCWFPPVPTYLGATVGGVVATNAAGAATFKYGPVRRWVQGLTVVLACGEVLRLRRGEVTASPEDTFVLATSRGDRRIPLPRIRMPDVPKCSAGYFSSPGMDLVDLFIGSEGTLGVITEAELAMKPRPAGVCWLRITLPSEEEAIDLAGDLRRERALDVAAIEHVDRRAIEVLREDGVDRRLGIDIDPRTDVILLVQIELDVRETDEGLSDMQLQALSALLTRHGAHDSTEIVLPSDRRRAEALVELREAVPAGVNRRVALAHARDARVHKTAADMVVPFERFAEMMRTCRRLCNAARLDLAVWGHISDGNVHPNVIPRDYADVECGREVIVELAREVIGMGGSPLAEHGVGRNRTKQQLLRMLYSDDGIASMEATKLSLDPEMKLAPGVLFEGRASHDVR
jgi:D-lactate dehydrogenase (cytochrome)